MQTQMIEIAQKVMVQSSSMIFAIFEVFDVRCGILDLLHVFIVLQLFIVLSLFVMLQVLSLSLDLPRISYLLRFSQWHILPTFRTLHPMRYHRWSSGGALILDIPPSSVMIPQTESV